jgi:cell division protein FtsL
MINKGVKSLEINKSIDNQVPFPKEDVDIYETPKPDIREKRKIFNSLIVIFVAFIIVILSIFLLQYKSNQLAKGFTKIGILTQVNKEREKIGIAPLVENAELDEIATKRGLDMKEKNYFSHYTPDGKSWNDTFKESGYSYNYAGENLAKGYLDEKELVSDWMSSKLHRENILYTNFENTGISIIETRNGNIIVQTFSKK